MKRTSMWCRYLKIFAVQEVWNIILYGILYGDVAVDMNAQN